jgi:hypothetical protein
MNRYQISAERHNNGGTVIVWKMKGWSNREEAERETAFCNRYYNTDTDEHGNSYTVNYYLQKEEN